MIPKPDYKPVSKKRTGSTRRRLKEYEREHPYCELCRYVGFVRQADRVHHITPVGMGGAPPDSPLHRESNLISVCAECHQWVHHQPEEGKKICRKVKDA